MRHLIRKLSYSTSEVVGYFNTVSDNFSVAMKDKSLKGYLNGYEVYSFPTKDKKFKNSYVVLASIIDNVFKSSNEDKLRLYKSEWGILKESSENLLEEIVPNLESPDIAVRNKPPQKRDTSPREDKELSFDDFISYKNLAKNLSVLSKKMFDLSEELEESLSIAKDLTRIKLKDSMWGAKDMQGTLNGLHSEFVFNYWKDADISFEVIQKSIERLIHKLTSKEIKNDVDEKKVSANVLIPSIINSYDKIKKALVHMVTLLAPLIIIDKTFTDKTSYPARFFISDKILEQTQDKFNSLIKFLCLLPTIEAKVIDPLDFVRVQMLNEIKDI